jgi:hypothetical protein
MNYKVVLNKSEEGLAFCVLVCPVAGPRATPKLERWQTFKTPSVNTWLLFHD